MLIYRGCCLYQKPNRKVTNLSLQLKKRQDYVKLVTMGLEPISIAFHVPKLICEIPLRWEGSAGKSSV